MFQGISASFNPIGPWPLLLLASLAVVVLTVWAYARKLRGPGARWRWVALSLRLLAVFLCLLAALRPSVIVQEKKKQPASVVFMIDSTTSMLLADEASGKTRWEEANKALESAVEAVKKVDPDLEVKAYRFASTLVEPKPDEAKPAEPTGRETQLGTAMIEAEKRQAESSRRAARMIILSDFASNNGVNPLVAARRMRDQQVPVVTVGFGSQNAGAGSRDIAVREITAGPTVFVKNKLEVRGALSARGYAGQQLDVELYVEGQTSPVAKTRVKVPEGADSVPISGLEYIPKSPGDQKVTLKVAPHDGELVVSNNEISTFVTVLSGGLNVLFLQGPNFTWDYRYLMRSIGTSPDIRVEGILIRRPAVGDKSEVDDAEFTPGRYNVYIISDMAAEFLTRKQHKLLADAVVKGSAGLIMLGGRNSFGPGGWGRTELADVLPVELHPGDGQIEPPGGVSFVPSASGLNKYLLQIGASPDESAKLWAGLPPLQGANRFGPPKQGAQILGTTSGAIPEPMMLTIETGRGRAIAYGGDTWVWARTDAGRLVHRKFWRQVIFWLSHKENQGDDQVKLSIDRRRASVGQSVELTVTGRNAKGEPLTDVVYETKVEREGPTPAGQPVELYTRGDEWKGSYPAIGEPGDYKITVVAKRNGQEVGRDAARFLVFQDDRELDNPSADLSLAKQIAEITSGEAVPPSSSSSTSRASTTPPTPSTSAPPSTASGTTGPSSCSSPPF
ncbi:glutamine amidotransferase [Paludisphaera borealis]|uniref:Putative glutamine amidotransferase domain-containing protein n=1 Tax=Paludisphaera borealis TaxID=1387353 RepID=A0A1U7CXX7_9BACT|nr:glutamine amidotransferase [Paludisphaera borealis]APW63797.1 hypothetical protein BSF38_05374 [Paludisphaera borealis]